jgi:hypothetical protein
VVNVLVFQGKDIQNGINFLEVAMFEHTICLIKNKEPNLLQLLEVWLALRCIMSIICSLNTHMTYSLVKGPKSSRRSYDDVWLFFQDTLLLFN